MDTTFFSNEFRLHKSLAELAVINITTTVVAMTQYVDDEPNAGTPNSGLMLLSTINAWGLTGLEASTIDVTSSNYQNINKSMLARFNQIKKYPALQTVLLETYAVVQSADPTVDAWAENLAERLGYNYSDLLESVKSTGVFYAEAIMIIILVLTSPEAREYLIAALDAVKDLQ